MMKTLRTLALGAASLLVMPLASEARLRRPEQSLTDTWQCLPIEPRRSTLLGIGFRPSQIDALGLDGRATLQALLTYPFQLNRLGAYWNRIQPEPGIFDAGNLIAKIFSVQAALFVEEESDL